MKKIIKEAVYIIDWDELMIFNELISKNECSCYSDEFLKLRSEIYDFIHNLA